MLHLSLPPPLHREEEVGGRALRGVLDPAYYLGTLEYNHLALHISSSAHDRVGSAGSVVASGVYWVPPGEIPGGAQYIPRTHNFSCSPTFNLANHYNKLQKVIIRRILVSPYRLCFSALPRGEYEEKKKFFFTFSRLFFLTSNFPFPLF